MSSDVEKWKLKYNNVRNKIDSSPSNGPIIVSFIRHVESARETDACLGTSTNVGYITAKSCCQSDDISLFDLKTFKEIPIAIDSLLIDENICFINTTQSFQFNYSVSENKKRRTCSMLMYENNLGQFIDQNLEIQIEDCLENTCLLDLNSYQNQTIFNGTSITCNESTHIGIVTNSQSL